MSRLMRAFHIDFNWKHLTTWVNITEQWPYRISWIIFYLETAAENKFTIEDTISLSEIYAKIRVSLPSHRDLEPLLGTIHILRITFVEIGFFIKKNYLSTLYFDQIFKL